MKKLRTPITKNDIAGLRAGDIISISGHIFAGRDAVLPKIVALAEDGGLAERGIALDGGVIFHTAVSGAGIGPTSSNKLEIESSIAPLSRHGVRIHIGKGEISAATVAALAESGSAFAVVPPVTALLKAKTRGCTPAAFPELGMEAFYDLEVEGLDVIVAAAHGETIFRGV